MSQKTLAELTDEELSELDNTLLRIKNETALLLDNLNGIPNLVILERHIGAYAAMGIDHETPSQWSVAQMLRGYSLHEAAEALDGVGCRTIDLSKKMMALLAEVDCTENIIFCRVGAELENVCASIDEQYLKWEQELTDAYKPILRKMEEIADLSIGKQDTRSLPVQAQYDIAKQTYDVLCMLGPFLTKLEQDSIKPEQADLPARIREQVDEWLSDKCYKPAEVSTITGAIGLVQVYIERLDL